MIEEGGKGIPSCRPFSGASWNSKESIAKHAGYKSEAERIAVNMPIPGQCGGSDQARAMLSLHEEIKDDERIMMILQVHDELVFEVRKDYLDEAIVLIRNKMEAAPLPAQE